MKYMRVIDLMIRKAAVFALVMCLLIPVFFGCAESGQGKVTESAQEPTMSESEFYDLAKSAKPSDADMEKITAKMKLTEAIELIGKPHRELTPSSIPYAATLMWESENGDLYSVFIYAEGSVSLVGRGRYEKMLEYGIIYAMNKNGQAVFTSKIGE